MEASGSFPHHRRTEDLQSADPGSLKLRLTEWEWLGMGRMPVRGSLPRSPKENQAEASYLPHQLSPQPRGVL